MNGQQITTLLFLMLLSMGFRPEDEKSGTLIINIDNVKETGGIIWIGIYDSEDTYMIKEKAIVKGFPKQNHLIVTTENIDKRRSLYKTIKKYGVILDCSVPKGDRWADKQAQDAVLKTSMDEFLRQHQKNIM